MKPLLARSNSSPQTSPSNFLKRTYRPSPISPYHLIHYHNEPDFGHIGSNVGGTGSSLVGGWLSRRGSVPDHHKQGASHDAGRGGMIGNQSRSPGNSRKGSVAQQDDVGKQRSGQEGRKAGAAPAVAAAANSTALRNKTPGVNATLKSARQVKAMEEISDSIKRLETTAGQQTTQLSDTYDHITAKLEELQAMTSRFAELQKSISEYVDNFAINEDKFVLDMEGQIKSLGVHQEEVSAIRVLQKRLDLQRMAVENYRSRLEAVEDKISRQKELEVVWRQRASRRLRIIWGIISVLVILWLLATSTHDSYPGCIDDGEEVDEQPPEQQFLEDALGVKFEYGSLPKEVLSVEAERLLRERHHHDEV